MKRFLSWMAVLLGCAGAVVAQETSPDGRGVFSVYGQINRGVLSFDDGVARDSYWFVDNSKSVSRIGATWDREMRNGWQFRGLGELALRWKETNAISQNDPNDRAYRFDRQEIRKVEAVFSHDRFGIISIGQGAMAADGFTGLDLSLTTVVAGTPVQDAAGGMLLRRVDGLDSTLRVNQAFRSMGSSRRLRVRYDSPTLNGMRFAVAAGREVLSFSNDRSYADVSARYDGDHGDFRLRGGGAYRMIERADDVFIASGSVLHRPSGWNLTLASGRETSGGRYAYAKVGFIGRWFDAGQTAISLDVYDGSNLAGVNGESLSYGVAVVQKVRNPKMDFYALLRRYDYDSTAVQYHAGTAFLAGARWRF